MADDRFRAALSRAGIDQPLPGRSIANVRWIAEHDDWWVYIDRQWYWWDRRASEWKASQYGPS